MRTKTIIYISINFYNDFYNDDIPIKTCVTNQMLDDVSRINIGGITGKHVDT